MPSADDLTGFIRTMNTAHKIALIVMVARGGQGQRGGDDGDDVTNKIALLVIVECIFSVIIFLSYITVAKRPSYGQLNIKPSYTIALYDVLM